MPDGLIVKANQTFLTLTGYGQVDLVGRLRFVDLLTAGGRIYHETHCAPMLQMHDTAREIALDVVFADGRRLPVLVNSVLEHDISGSSTIVRTAVFDASQRRAYERELLRTKQRAEESELRASKLAQTLQGSFIPPTHPHIPGLELAAAYRPAGDGSEIGGDFYDVFEIGPDDWCMVIGDVSGQGVEAVGCHFARSLYRPGGRGSSGRTLRCSRYPQRGAPPSRNRPLLHSYSPPASPRIIRSLDSNRKLRRPPTALSDPPTSPSDHLRAARIASGCSRRPSLLRHYGQARRWRRDLGVHRWRYRSSPPKGRLLW